MQKQRKHWSLLEYDTTFTGKQFLPFQQRLLPLSSKFQTCKKNSSTGTALYPTRQSSFTTISVRTSNLTKQALPYTFYKTVQQTCFEQFITKTIKDFDGNIKFLTDIHKPWIDQLLFVGVKLQLSHQHTQYSTDLHTLQESQHYIIPHWHLLHTIRRG
jgi:hypothetical protein